jgi:hypothetical protein
MGDMREFTTVACRFDDVPERLVAAFGGADTILPLRVRLGDLRIERDVDVHLTPRSGYPGYRLVDISWKPQGGGPYPSFAGTLSIAEDAVGWSRIEIYGKYRPPFGIAGAAFDAAIGQRIAHGTAIELLAEIKRLLLSGSGHSSSNVGPSDVVEPVAGP